MIKKSILYFLTICATLSATPQAIVFDFGGVMTTEPNREAVVHFLRTSFNLSAEEFEKVNQEKKKAIKAGKTDVEFWLQYAEDTKTSLPVEWVQAFNAVMKEAIGINHAMYSLVKQLKEKGFPVALLSNIDERLAKLIREFGFYEPFNPCLLSCELGLEKPNPKIYEILIEEMGLPANEILFVDDKSENVEAAEKLGLDAVIFISLEQFQAELKNKGIQLHD